METAYVELASQMYATVSTKKAESPRLGQAVQSADANTAKKHELHTADPEQPKNGRQKAPAQLHVIRITEHVDHSQPVSPLTTGRQAQRHSEVTQYTSEVGDSGILNIFLGVYDFRGTLPEGMQPKGPHLRWETEPAPQLPPYESAGSSIFYEDEDLAKFMTADKSNIKSFEDKMPLATSVAKGDMNKSMKG